MENCKFPRELLIEILARLPVKSLMRFKSVCKFFYFLIKSDNHFQHKHYEISRVSRDYVIFQREIGLREFPLWREEVFGLVYKELDSDEIGCVNLTLPRSWIVNVKCIDGILCLITRRTDGTRDILIWNPSTHEIKTLPPISPPHNFPLDPLKEVIGFGFCNNMTGKVVIVWGAEGCEYKVMVCSQVGNLWGWREINPYPHFDPLWSRPDYDIYLKGKYYWYLYAYPGDEIKHYLLWFDMSAETFGTISLPFNPPGQYGNGGKGFIRCVVSVMNDNIAVIGYPEKENHWEVWLMIENDSDVNWHKYAWFDSGDDFWKPMQIWNQDRHLLICRMGAEEDDREPHLVSIDLVTGEKKKRIDNINTHSSECFLAYSESLKMF